MTDQPTGPAPPAPSSIAGQIVAVLYAMREVASSLLPYGVAAWAIAEAVRLNDPQFTKGLIYGLFSAALIAINPHPRADLGARRDGGQ